MRDYQFVDGGCLRAELERFAENYSILPNLKVNWSALSSHFKKTFYYDSPITQNDNAGHNEKTFDWGRKGFFVDGIERSEALHVRTGNLVSNSKRNEQKMVDVLLAVDALSMANRNLFSTCSILSGDLDFKPLISALVDSGIDVQLHYPAGRTSQKLINAADRSTALNLHFFLSLLDPQLRSIFPTGYSTLQTDPLDLSGKIISEGNSETYGIYYLREKDEKFFFTTTICKYNPKTHRQDLVGTDLNVMIQYIKDEFEIDLSSYSSRANPLI